MGISVGSIVTRYDPNDAEISCETDEMPCIGHIVTIESEDLYPDNPAVVVKWWHSCSYHANRLNVDMRYTLDQTWEIGQIPTT
jgi:hypothetical protein